MGHQTGAEVVQRLLRQVRFLRRQAQRVVPQQVELETLQRFGVGQVVHVLQDQHAQHGLHRAVRTTVVLAIQRREQVFVDQRQRPGPKRLCPTGSQATRLDLRNQVAGLEHRHLRVSSAIHLIRPNLSNKGIGNRGCS